MPSKCGDRRRRRPPAARGGPRRAGGAAAAGAYSSTGARSISLGGALVDARVGQRLASPSAPRRRSRPRFRPDDEEVARERDDAVGPAGGAGSARRRRGRRPASSSGSPAASASASSSPSHGRMSRSGSIGPSPPGRARAPRARQPPVDRRAARAAIKRRVGAAPARPSERRARRQAGSARVLGDRDQGQRACRARAAARRPAQAAAGRHRAQPRRRPVPRSRCFRSTKSMMSGMPSSA